MTSGTTYYAKVGFDDIPVRPLYRVVHDDHQQIHAEQVWRTMEGNWEQSSAVMASFTGQWGSALIEEIDETAARRLARDAFADEPG